MNQVELIGIVTIVISITGILCFYNYKLLKLRLEHDLNNSESAEETRKSEWPWYEQWHTSKTENTYTDGAASFTKGDIDQALTDCHKPSKK